LLGNGDGSFTTAAGPSFNKASGSLSLADLNNDGMLDLAVPSATDGTVTILLGNGDGSFTQKSDYSTGLDSSGTSIADFNGDGIPDIAVAGSYNGTVSILTGKGDGTFVIVTDSMGQFVYAVTLTAVDLNGDGVPDLPTPLNSIGSMNVLLAQPDTTVTLSGVSLEGGGTHNIVASYSGDTLYQPSVSAPVSLDNTTAPPAIYPGTGSYAFPLTVTIQDATPGAEIYYTLDGTTPGSGSSLYSSPIALATGGTVRAIAIAPHFAASAVTAVTYASALPTAVALSIAPGTSVETGTPVTLSAYVTSNGAPFHNGVVLFCRAEAVHCEDAAILGSAPVASGGWAKLRLRFGVGSYNIRAVFLGTSDSANPKLGSVSAVQALTVRGKVTTVTTAISSEVVDGVYKLTSRVAAFGRPAISGSLVFTDSLNGGRSVSLSSTT
jgi:hypothetical protein